MIRVHHYSIRAYLYANNRFISAKQQTAKSRFLNGIDQYIIEHTYAIDDIKV
ncbi:hypothetical protein [Paenibacillus amylolyticus]|uniref:hypothetical protein n=1 Tax=Paenibacillus amylolyticus TaxID=1451 RepID=UPI0012E349E3|nr:hypothetical protein [Paenibacillus amylolyticus]